MAKSYLLALLCALAASPVSAALVSFTWNSEVDGGIAPTIPGVAVGDPVTVEIIADNGNSSLASQEWFIEDVISATVSIGLSYSATFTNDDEVLNDFLVAGAPSTVPAFVTNGASVLTAARFNGTNQLNITDTFDLSGTGTGRLYNTQITATNDGDAYFTERFYIGQNVFEGWDNTPTIVPEPASLCLALLGVVSFLRRGSR
jgi:hypothetical protein